MFCPVPVKDLYRALKENKCPVYCPGFPSLLQWIQAPFILQQSSTVSTSIDGEDFVQWQQRDAWRAAIQLTQTTPSSSMQLCFVYVVPQLVSYIQRLLSWIKLVVVSCENSKRFVRAGAGVRRSALPSHCAREALCGGDKAARNA